MERGRRVRRYPRRAAVALASALAVAAVNLPAGAVAGAATVIRNATVQTTAAASITITGISATPTGAGYWRVAGDGTVLTSGDAVNYGSARGLVNGFAIAIAGTRSGRGYWIADTSGDVFSFGDARFHGSMGGRRLNLPVVGMAARPDGNGYWLVASDGGIFAFGAPFFGSTGAMRLNQPISGMAAEPSGRGYTMVASDGGLFRFGTNSPFYGSAVNACPGGPAVAVTMSPGAKGYWIAFADGRTYAFSPSSSAPRCGPPTGSRTDQMAADLFTRLNQERAARGLAALTWDPTLASYASSWSANMAGQGFRHSNIGDLLGTYNYVGENIAAGSAGTYEGSLHNAWMHSDGHRENILAPGYSQVGIGVYCAPDGGIWMTEDFGHLTSAGAPHVSSSIPPLDPIARPDSGSLKC